MPVFTKSRKPLSAGAARALRRSVGAAVTGLRDLDLSRLEPDEQHEFADLEREISHTTEGRSRDPRNLSERKRHRYLELAAVAGGLERDHFRKLEEEGKAKSRLAELARAATRPRPQRRVEEPGTIVLPPEIFGALVDGVGLAAGDLAVLVICLAQLQNGPLTRFAEIVDGELVVTYGPVQPALDPDGDLVGSKRSLDWLAQAGYLKVTRVNADKMRIALGPILRAAFERRDAK